MLWPNLADDIFKYLCPSTYGEGTYIDYSVDPIGVGICVSIGAGVGMTLSCLVNQWLDSYQIFMDISLGQEKEMIRLW